MADHWKSIANMLGAPGMDVTSDEENTAPEEEKASADSENAGSSDAQPEAEAASTEASTSEVAEEVVADSAAEAPEVISAVAPKPVPTAKDDSAPEVKPKKKKSSWESLANMFNVRVTREEAPPAETPDHVDTAPTESPVAESSPEDRADSDVRASDSGISSAETPALAIFGEDDEASDSANPALDAMFGDAPRQDTEDWPTKRRVVDDVGWDDVDEADDLASARFQKDEVPSESVDEDSQEEDDDSRNRRGRRRRRGRRGRGGRQEESNRQEDTGRSSKNDDAPVDEASSQDDVSEVSWSEADRLETDDEPTEVERRSNRRRRRGRSRPADETKTEESVEDESVASDDFDQEEAAPRAKSRNDRDGQRRRKRRPDARRDGDSRREGEKRRGDETRSRSAASNADRDDAEDADDDQDESPKHRNIPTWLEAVQPMVEGNIENHRRNENRGGRGRSRGRR